MFSVFKNSHPYFTPIWFIQVWLIIEIVINLIGISDSQLLSLTRYFVFFVASSMLINSLLKKYTSINLFNKLFLLWIAVLLIASVPTLLSGFRNYIYFKQFISGVSFMYLTMFLIAAKLDIEFYNRIFKFCYQLILIYLVISIPLFPLFIKDLSFGAEGYTSFASAGSILLLTLPYHTKKKRTIIIIAVILAVIIMMILARRNKVVYFGLVLFFTYFINLFFKNTLHSVSKLTLIRSAIVLIFFFSITLVSFSEKFDYFWERMDTGMESREDIIELFIYDFNRTPEDWIWGRGIFGQFEGGILADEETGLRDGIENGYYQTFLKGGGIFLFLLALVSINAAYKGFFKSNNILCKGFASLIIIFFISMIGMNQYGITLKSIFVFIAISACNSKDLRGLTDQYLANKIGLK